MSTVSVQGEFDFWEFVNCGVCHLEFVKESGSLSTIPFWLTECGHVVCNSHLKADQSCAQCGSRGVQVRPLARNMEPPMSNWFESATLAFDAVGFALRFQINTLASLVRYFKKKYMQYRPLYERLKEEHAETKRLKKMLEDLRQENQQLKLRLQASGDRIDESNKRQRVDDDGRYVTQRTSSPRSVTSVPTPARPERLTLPPDQLNLNSRQPLRTYASATPRQLLSRYAYAPPRSAQGQIVAIPTLSHGQSGSIRLAQAREQGDLPGEHQSMPPPPIPADRTANPRFRKPTPTSQLESSAPQPLLATQLSSSANCFTPHSPMRPPTESIPTASRAFLLGNHSQQQVQRFLPSNANVQRIPPTVSLTTRTVSQSSSRSPSVAVSGSGRQRTPFVPSTAGGLS